MTDNQKQHLRKDYWKLVIFCVVVYSIIYFALLPGINGSLRDLFRILVILFGAGSITYPLFLIIKTYDKSEGAYSNMRHFCWRVALFSTLVYGAIYLFVRPAVIVRHKDVFDMLLLMGYGLTLGHILRRLVATYRKPKSD